MKINFYKLIQACKYCQVRRRDGEWIDVCTHPIFESKEDVHCNVENCPLKS